MNELPKDPVMLLSVVNMKLRDCYNSLGELCEDINVPLEELCGRLRAVQYEYDPETNQFK